MPSDKFIRHSAAPALSSFAQATEALERAGFDPNTFLEFSSGFFHMLKQAAETASALRGEEDTCAQALLEAQDAIWDAILLVQGQGTLAKRISFSCPYLQQLLHSLTRCHENFESAEMLSSMGGYAEYSEIHEWLQFHDTLYRVWIPLAERALSELPTVIDPPRGAGLN